MVWSRISPICGHTRKNDTKIDTFGWDRADHFLLKLRLFISSCSRFKTPVFVTIKFFSNYAERFFDFAECCLLKGKNDRYSCGHKSATQIEQMIRKINPETEISIIDDMMELINYGIMSTPAIVINDKVVHKGSIPTEEELKKIL